MELPAVNLKMILLVHWLLTTWGCITFSGPYPWANFTILAVGVWAVAQRDSVDAMSLGEWSCLVQTWVLPASRSVFQQDLRTQFLGGLAATIFLDIVHISVFYRQASFTDTQRFGAGMAILSLLLKPLSCCFVYHMYRERGGFLGPSQERSGYQTIDSPEAPTDPFVGSEGRSHSPQGY
ncbi:type-1 angiotensin II receptor-associated protein isoform X2 [Mustela nigripes]|uniref:Type-1 angiotensin II receptor-associated protein isoform X2 n=1 Tax=Mustela putorius furo TaxID=9669 RepID=A0A8U0UKI2_MUSPF|nr:type-1 angiotensin II receptor-associated protein isoform X2 [Mustela putorius furo]XP_058992542.1 type-1 angiotensin II receptor-associated protein isoform X2 [Mustela lutreola]XP_059231551.1 type-1 angiotensin II receptor-associated protein isoform X2 [Mustela nigripes]